MKTTMRDLIERFVGELTVRNCSRHTIDAYRSDLTHYLRFLRKSGRPDPTLEDFTGQSVAVFAGSMMRAGLASATVRRRVACLDCFGRFLVAQRYLRDNPVDRVYTPKAQRPLPTVLSEEDMRWALDSLRHETSTQLRDAAIVELLYGSGIRVSELVSLDLMDVRWGTKPADTLIKVLGKGSRERIVPLGKAAAVALCIWILVRAPRATDGALFLSLRGRRLTARSVQRIVRSRFAASSHVSPHVLRHSFATQSRLGWRLVLQEDE